MLKYMTILFDNFKDIVEEQVNDISTTSLNHKSHSIKELLHEAIGDDIITQSQLIRLGCKLEKSFKILMFKYIIDPPVDLGYQIDLLFEYKKCIYYFEIKSNVNLDTEKSRAIAEKLQTIHTLLKTHNNKVVCKVLALRHPHSSDYTFVKSPLKANVIGYSDFFSIIDCKVSHEDWKELFKCIGYALKFRSNIPVIEDIPKKNLKSSPLTPIFKWSGGKSKEIKIVENYFPEHFDTFIEPFVGGGSVLFYLQHSKNIINDIHPDVYNFYETMKHHSEEVKAYVDTFRNEEELYYTIRSNTDPDPIYRAARFLYLRKTCYRGMIRYNQKGEFNIPFGKYKSISYDKQFYAPHVDLLRHTTIHNIDFLECCRQYDQPDNFVFLDPPYDSTFSNYGASFTKLDHIRLYEWFSQAKCKCMLIIGETAFINGLYHKYIKARYFKKYAFKIHSNRVESKNIDNYHLIITNY